MRLDLYLALQAAVLPLLQRCGGCLLAVKILTQALAEMDVNNWRQLTEISSFLDDPAYQDGNKTCFQVIALSLDCILVEADDQSREENVRQRMQALEGLALFQSSVSLPSGLLWLAFRLLDGSAHKLSKYEGILLQLQKSNLLEVSITRAFEYCKAHESY